MKKTRAWVIRGPRDQKPDRETFAWTRRDAMDIFDSGAAGLCSADDRNAWWKRQRRRGFRAVKVTVAFEE
jgi:hypothetical protein